MNDLQLILQQLEAEKSVDRATLIEAIRSAIESAARKRYTDSAHIIVDVDTDTLEFSVFEVKTVAETVEDPQSEIPLEEGQKLNPHVEIGQRLKLPMEPKDFGRIAAQTAKQVIIQKIKDAERDNIFDEFKTRVGELITGVVKRISHGNVIVGVNKAEAIIPGRERPERESFKPGDRVRAYVMEVEKGPRGAQIVLSRTTPELVRALFKLEVPEIFDGTVEIKAIAREPGSRTKIAVHSYDPNVDPVGACVGMKGARVRAVVEELSGEKIDIVRWTEDPVEFCRNALNPADLLKIDLDEENKAIRVLVPYDQLSLAIGKRGQNARLASRLLGWNIDIRSEEPPPTEEPEGESLGAVLGTEGAEAAAMEPVPEAPSAISVSPESAELEPDVVTSEPVATDDSGETEAETAEETEHAVGENGADVESPAVDVVSTDTEKS